VALGGCDLSVLYVGGEWQWFVRQAGRRCGAGCCRGQATGRSGGAALQCASRINHVVGDWGVVGAEEAAHNDESLKDGGLCVVRLPDRSTPPERRAWR